MIEKLKKFAKENFVPIVRPKTSELLIEMVKKCNPKNILEIGTAIGYSGILMLNNTNANLVTIEKDENMAKLAKQNFEQAGLSKRVTLIHQDAMEYINSETNKYDFIFLDGPKGQYVKYYPILLKLLNAGGTIFADNVLFQGLVLSNELPPKKNRTIVVNLRKFIDIVQKDARVESNLLQLEDGVLIIKKIA